MFGIEISALSTGLFIAFIACLVMTFFFEFVNGGNSIRRIVETVDKFKEKSHDKASNECYK